MEASMLIPEASGEPADEPREMTLTVMFTDIEGSTALNERLGDEAWVELVLMHNEIVRDRVWRLGGREVKFRGDGFMVVFDDPVDAARCAISIQRVLADVVERYSKIELPVRLGLHHGRVLRAFDEVVGAAVNVAEQVMSAASGGQILASGDFRAAVAHENIDFGDSVDVDGRRAYPLSWRGPLAA